MKIAVFDIEDWEKEYIASKLTGNEIVFTHDPLKIENVDQYADVEAISIFITSNIDRALLDKMPNLKFITTRSTGFDHIDLFCCKEKNITVSYVPHYGTHTVAEHAFALILGLTRNLYKSIDRTRHGQFDHKELTGFDLYGKTLGIVGLGDIGMSVLQIAKGFGMDVVAYAHHPDEKLARKLGVTFLSVKELLPVSDIITLHLPYMKETHHIINKRNIKKFKQGAILINTARGALVETEALIYGLEKGILGGIGVDVLEEENIIEEERQILTDHFLKREELKTLYFDHILMDMDNVIITPHNAFNSTEALQLILDTTIDNIVNFQKQTPANTVTAK